MYQAYLDAGIEAFLVGIIVAIVPASRAAAPFCKDCGSWCDKQPDLFTLPGVSDARLAESILEGNASGVAE